MMTYNMKRSGRSQFQGIIPGRNGKNHENLSLSRRPPGGTSATGSRTCNHPTAKFGQEGRGTGGREGKKFFQVTYSPALQTGN